VASRSFCCQGHGEHRVHEAAAKESALQAGPRSDDILDEHSRDAETQDLADRLNMPITFQIASVADDYYHNADIENVLKVNSEDA
jgi:hypothetical protein